MSTIVDAITLAEWACGEMYLKIKNVYYCRSPLKFFLLLQLGI